MFYQIRTNFNNKSAYDDLQIAGMFIFLNKTCFNGLFRLNKKGEFNVPFAFNKNPSFYDLENISSCSKSLQRAEIYQMDFFESLKYIKDKSFIYLDPPYKPISKTSSFNNYSGNEFDDNEQTRLSVAVQKMSNLDHQILLSNSDDGSDFFQNLYGERFYFQKIQASRMINSVGSSRGKISELLISNYNNFIESVKKYEQQSLGFNF
jgi:DNA adenine methylase